MDVWKHRYEAYQRDDLWRARREDLFEERRLTQQAMRSFLRHFVDGNLSLQEFRAVIKRLEPQTAVLL